MDASDVVSNDGSFSSDVFSVIAVNFSVNTSDGALANGQVHGFNGVCTTSVTLHFIVFIKIVNPKFQSVDAFIHGGSNRGVESVLRVSIGFHRSSLASGGRDFELFFVNLLWHNSHKGRLICCVARHSFIDPGGTIRFTSTRTLGVCGVCVSFSVSVGGNHCVPG